MYIDKSTAQVFSSYDTPVALTATANSSVLDLAGVGSSVAPDFDWGTSTVFGLDIGAAEGNDRPWVLFDVVTTLDSAGEAATLTVALYGAIDNGSNVAGSYVLMHQGPAFAEAVLSAGFKYQFPIPPWTSTGLPRFLRLTYTVGTENFTSGTISAGIVIGPETGLVGVQYPANFIVAGG